jgi:serine phosphatase RsbU (regulator of sigma subunit)
MTTKWELNRQNRNHIINLEKRIAERTNDLQLLIKEKEGYINNIREEMTLAEIVQQQLLPTELPKLKTTDVAALYIPTEKIGGDFYDVIPLSDEKVAFLIFDVSGHGIAAALVTAIGKFSFRQHLNESITPEKVLELVNKDIFQSTPPQMYITAFLMIYNLRNKKLLYSGAGHVPQLYYRAENNELKEMQGRGLFLGIDKGVTYNQYDSLKLNKGDKILLYTDGLTETFNNKEKMYGRGRIKKLILKDPKMNCDKLLKRIIKSNKLFKKNQKRADDVCILAIDIQ